MKSMNGQLDYRQTPESIENQIEHPELRKIELETRLIEAGMRHDRLRLALDVVKWSVIGAAVVLATIAARRVGLI